MALAPRATSGRVPLVPTVPLRVPTTTTPGPSRLTDLTTTPDGASLTTPLRPRATPTRTTLARSAPTMTNGPRITTGMTPVTPMLTATPPPGGARTARVAPA